jgi:calcineurin-like phosphoesterase family protein
MIFFTSDHHFGHTNIIKYCSRPFSSVEEMDAEMLRRWNEVVNPKDTVYYLGDFSLAKRAVLDIAPRLHGEKHLIMGNHDACHPCHKKKAEAAKQLYIEAGFKSLALEMSFEIKGHRVLLTHMPFLEKNAQAAYDLRYPQYRPKDEGQWLLHGHVHEKWRINGRMINVGVDVWNFYPVPLEEIENIL